MALRKVEQDTVRYYDEKAQDWISGHSSERFWGAWLDKFHELLPSGKILEVGSGGGRDAKELLMFGYDYVGTDISVGLLEAARLLNPSAKFVESSVYDLDFPENTFDGFWASAILLHVPKDRIDEALGQVKHVVKSGGLGFISVKKGQGEKVEDDGRLFAYYQEGEFAGVLARNMLEVVDTETVPMSEKTVWLVYLVRVKKH